MLCRIFTKLIILWLIIIVNAEVEANETLNDLANIHPSPPKCMQQLAKECPQFYDAALNCSRINSSEIAVCYANAISNISCTSICVNGSDPFQYLTWTLGVLNVSAFKVNKQLSSFETSWQDYNFYTHETYALLLPWHWTLVSSNSSNNTDDNQDCESPGTVLTAFAIDNIVVAVSSLLVSSRHVISWLTGGILGKPGTYNWPLMALLPVVVNVLSNLINSILIHTSPGFHNVSLNHLFWLLSTRPRLSWLVVLIALNCECGSHRENGVSNTYICSAVTGIVSEVVLQALGSAYYFITVHHAIANGLLSYDEVMHLIPGGSAAQKMYVGAVLWLAMACCLLVVVVLTFTSAEDVLQHILARVLNGIRIVWAKLRNKNDDAGTLHEEDDAGTSHSEGQSAMVNEDADYAQVELSIGVRPIDGPNMTWISQTYPSYHATRPPKKLTAEEKRRRKEKRKKRDQKSRLRRQAWISTRDELLAMGFEKPVVVAYQLAGFFVLILISFTAQWIFWAGFIELAWIEKRYCPPHIWTMSGIWAALSGLGVLLGGGG